MKIYFYFCLKQVYFSHYENIDFGCWASWWQALATNLSSDGYEVTVVDEDSDKLADLDDSVDLRTVLGHASHPLTLRKAGCDKDTVLLSLTNNDEVNLIASKIAKSSFNAKKTICRLSDSSYITEKKLIDDFVDIPISPENDITEHLFSVDNTSRYKSN